MGRIGWFIVIVAFVGLMWMIFKPVMDIINTDILSGVAGITSFETIWWKLILFIIAGIFILYGFYRLSGRGGKGGTSIGGGQ